MAPGQTLPHPDNQLLDFKRWSVGHTIEAHLTLTDRSKTSGRNWGQIPAQDSQVLQ